jgi:flagellar biosynthetic protein FliQ
LDVAAVIELVRGALAMALLLAMPLLAVTLLIGVVISLLQAVTSLQDSTLNFVPKVLGLLAVLAVSAPWMLGRLVGYTRELLAHLDSVAR